MVGVGGKLRDGFGNPLTVHSAERAHRHSALPRFAWEGRCGGAGLRYNRTRAQVTGRAGGCWCVPSSNSSQRGKPKLSPRFVIDRPCRACTSLRMYADPATMLCPIHLPGQVAQGMTITANLEYYDVILDRKVWLGSVPSMSPSVVKVRATVCKFIMQALCTPVSLARYFA